MMHEAILELVHLPRSGHALCFRAHSVWADTQHTNIADLLEMRRMSVKKGKRVCFVFVLCLHLVMCRNVLISLSIAAPESIRAAFTALAITLGGEYDLADEKSSLKHLAPGKTTAWHQSAQVQDIVSVGAH